MISAVVLTPDSWRGDDLSREREIVARSMVWLVSAVVAGTVRDVTLAVPPGLGLSALADQSGCALVQADKESERLATAIAGCRESRVMVLKAGYQPDSSLIEEIDLFVRGQPSEARALLFDTPSTLLQRLFPQRAAIVGVLIPRAEPANGGFISLVRAVRRKGVPLHARARPIR